MASTDDTTRPGPYARFSGTRRFRRGTTVALFVIGPALVGMIRSPAPGPPTDVPFSWATLGVLVAALVLAFLVERRTWRTVEATYAHETLVVPYLRRHGHAADRCGRVALYLAGVCWVVVVLNGNLDPADDAGSVLNGVLGFVLWILLLGGAALKQYAEQGEPGAATTERTTALRARIAGYGPEVDSLVRDLAQRIDDKLAELDAVGERLREAEELRPLLDEPVRAVAERLLADAQRRNERSGLRMQLVFLALGLVLGIGTGILVNWISTRYLGL